MVVLAADNEQLNDSNEIIDRLSRNATFGFLDVNGVVQRTTGSGSWYHVQLGGETDTRGYRRGHLEIDTRKPAARKPAAKKRKAAEPARKPASKKKKSRK